MKSKEDIVVGIATFPETLLKLFNGENFWETGVAGRGGVAVKLVSRVDQPSTTASADGVLGVPTQSTAQTDHSLAAAPGVLAH